MTPEGKIKSDVQKALTQLGLFWIRVNSGQTRVRGGFIHGAKKGTADIVVFVRPSFFSTPLWLETKAGKNPQTPEQREFEHKVTAIYGHDYRVIRSIDDLMDVLKEKK
jgi:hypothetical protein